MPAASALAPPNAPPPAPHAPPPPVPDGIPPRDVQARRDFLSDAVMLAVARAVKLLGDEDSKVVLGAVSEILAVEKTRMRHGRPILGAHEKYIEDIRRDLGEPGDLSLAELYNPPEPAEEYEHDFDEEFDEPAVYQPPPEPPPLPEFTRDPDYPGGPILSRDPAKIGPPGSAVPPWEKDEADEEEEEKPSRMADLRAALDPTPARQGAEAEATVDAPQMKYIPQFLISLRE